MLFFLSGESTSIPAAEAVALLRMQDPAAEAVPAEGRVLIARTCADPDKIAARVAFSRRVGSLILDGEPDQDQLRRVREGRYRVRVFTLEEGRMTGEEEGGGGGEEEALIDSLVERFGGRVAMNNPDWEVTVIRGRRDYFALTRPCLLRQDWVARRPRARAFFHPAAIFPKLSRALVNLARVEPGGVFLDPLCGTGSLLLEAYETGALPLGADNDARMVQGASRNMDMFRQGWLGVIRSEVGSLPVRKVDGVATDVPYGRASSVSGSTTRDVIDTLLRACAPLLEEGRALVVMHPQSVPIAEHADGFEIEGEHHLYVHRKLTRTISILRRV